MASVHEILPDAALRLTTLGAGAIALSSPAGERSLGPGKPLALLAYLAFAPGHAATRDALLDLLWSDVEPEPGRHAMRQMVLYIKKRLGDGVLVAARDAIRLALPVTSDRDDFLRAVDDERFDEAVRLYTGDFLPNLALPGAVEFEHWCDLERQRLRMAYLHAGQATVRALLGAARHREAIALARRLRDAEGSESNWRLLLEALIAARDRAGAAVEADAFARLVEQEEREPEAATRALLRAARQELPADRHEGGRPSLVSELVGRETEFTGLLAEWERVRLGEGRHVDLFGPAGIGKSRLLADFAARLRSQRARVVSVAARSGERFIPYSLASELVTALAELPGAAGIDPSAAASLVAINPSLAHTFHVATDVADGGEAMRRRAIAIRELLSAVSDERPLALVVDDWHWGDESSHRVLSSAIERISTQRVLLVTAVRPGYASLRTSATQSIRLIPLSESDVGRLIATIAPPPADCAAEVFARAVHRASEGSPLLVLETLQWLLDAGICALDPCGWRVLDEARLTATAATRSAIRNRLAALTNVEGRIIGCLALAGIPLATHFIARVLAMPEGAAANQCEQLESRGFLVRIESSWGISHDAIAEESVARMGESERAAASLALGQAWLASPTPSPIDLLRGGRMLLTGGHTAAASRAFVRWVRLGRRAGDARGRRELAADFAGPLATPDVVRTCARALPLALRYHASPLAVASAGGVAFALTLAVLWLALRAAPAPPDARLLVFDVADDRPPRVTSIDVRSDAVDAGRTLHGGKWTRARFEMPTAMRLSPDGRERAGYRVFSDGGGLDLVSIDVKSDVERRLTDDPDDDVDPAWSPTGTEIVFATGRFDSLKHNDLAILDVATRHVRQLTSGAEYSDGRPAWNPRGDVIAFARRFWVGSRGGELCFVTPNGLSVTCRAVPGIVDPSPIAWYDAEHLLITQTEEVNGAAVLALNDARSHTMQLLRRSGRYYDVSSDGKWVTCLCSENAGWAPQWEVFSVDRPSVASTVAVDAPRDEPLRVFWQGAGTPEYLTRVMIDRRAPIPLSTSYHLSASGEAADGRTFAALRVQWGSLDSAVATVDSSGVVHPRRVGTFRVRASAGGWVTTTAEMTVVRPTAMTRDTFDWSWRDTARVMLFGDPTPTFRVDQRLGPAFFTNGDGSLTSGLMTSHPYASDAGIGVEAVVSTPITRSQWQALDIRFDPAVDTARLQHWDRRTGLFPDLPHGLAGCGVELPAGEGPTESAHLGVIGIPAIDEPFPESLRSGRPFHVRVQLLPDGRCGVAINGTVVGISSGALPVGRYYLVIEGSTVGTTMLVGHTEVWTGVRGGVNWQ